MYSHAVEETLHLGTLRQIFVQIIKVLKLKFRHRYAIDLSRWQAGHVQRLLDTFPILFILRKKFNDAKVVTTRTITDDGTGVPGWRGGLREFVVQPDNAVRVVDDVVDVSDA